MVLKVYKYGEKVLREKSVPVKAVTDALRKIADDMLETMHKARGVGLAAQQVGRLERMCVIDIPEGCEDEFDEVFNAPIRMPLKLWNPEIVMSEGSQEDKEGCLSFPEIGGRIVRAEQVTATYLDEDNRPQTSPRYPESIVPGVLSTVTPLLSASPERGRTWASYIGGSSITSPVWTSARLPAGMTISSTERTSMPASLG